MNNFELNYPIKKLNRDINELIVDKKVNSLKMFVSAEKNEKLSVTIEPDKSKNDLYHGLRPDFDEKALRIFLKSLENNSIVNFWKAIRKLQRQKCRPMNLIIPDFSEEEDINELYLQQLISNEVIKENLEEKLLGKAILQMSSHFGYEIIADQDELYEELRKELVDIDLCRNIFYSYEDKIKVVKLLGIYPNHIITRLCKKFDVKILGHKLILKKNITSETNNSLFGLMNFRSDANLKHFKLQTSGVYYSGVMPCVRSIECEKNYSLSQKVKYLVFKSVRTTFGTVDTMDNSEILNHPFFDINSRGILIDFDHYEDILQSKYLNYNGIDELSSTLDNKEYEQSMIESLNQYLRYSLNTHTIAVSANLTTEDGYLIACKRGNLNIDAGEYYCSANGQTEFRDENVSFYRKSVFEDMPTMDYFSKYRVDLNQEFERECIAELGVSSYGLEWDYYGVSYLSINNEELELTSDEHGKGKFAKSRRMHFNVLAGNTISQSFREVIKSHKTATESFENESIVGIKIRIFKNHRDLVRSSGRYLYYWLDENKSKIFLMLFFISVIIGKRSYQSMEISNYFDIFLLGVYLIMNLLSWKNDRYIRKQRLVLNYYLPDYNTGNELKMNKMLLQLLKKTDGVSFHGIFNIMYSLYLLRILDDES